MKLKKSHELHQTTFLRTGSYVFDFLSGGGVPLGKISEFFGAPSSGKSSFVLMFLKKVNFPAVYFDLEYSIDKAFAERFGLGSNICFVQESLEGEALITAILDSFKKADLVVLDSLAAIEASSSALARQAFLVTKLLRQIAQLLPQGKTLIILNQLRTQQLGQALFVVDSSGGYALKHFTHLRVKFDKKTVKGTTQEIEFKVLKCKLPALPYNRGIAIYDFNKNEFDYSFEFLKLGEVFSLIETTESGIIYSGTKELIKKRQYKSWFEKNRDQLLGELETQLNLYFEALQKRT